MDFSARQQFGQQQQFLKVQVRTPQEDTVNFGRIVGAIQKAPRFF